MSIFSKSLIANLRILKYGLLIKILNTKDGRRNKHYFSVTHKKITCYSMEPKDGIFVKSYGFLCFAKNMSKNVDKNISKMLSGKCSQKSLDHGKQYAANSLKSTSKRFIKKTRRKN